MALDKVEKQPYEVFWVSSSFTKDLGDDEGVASSIVTATDVDGTDATADIIVSGTSMFAGHICYVQIKAGTEALSPYKLTFRIVSDADPVNKWENDIRVKVKEL